MNEQVILLHGIGRTAFLLHRLADFLRDDFIVHNLSYPSTDYPMEELVPHIRDIVQDVINPELRTHFVGFSMGGLMARGVLNGWRPMKMGHVVLIGTPNRGSEVADFVRNWWFFEKLYGPAGQQLTTDAALDTVLGVPDYPCGIIAGNRSLDPFCSWMFHGPNDGKVSVDSTKLDTMTDHIILPSTHLGFPYKKEAHVQTHHFLTHGMFDHHVE